MTRPVTPAAAREMLDGATPGPWSTDYDDDAAEGDDAAPFTAVFGETRGLGARMVAEVRGGMPADLADAALIAASPDLAATVASEPERIAAAVAAEADRIYRAATAGLDDYLAADAKLLDALGRREVIDEYHPLILARMRRLDYLRGLLTPETTT